MENSMNLKPLNDILVIKRIMDEQPRTSSGILLPPTEEAADTPYTGVVLAAGPGKPCTIQPAANVVDGALRAVVSGIVGAELTRRLETTQGVFAVLRGYEEVYDGAVRREGRLTFADVTLERGATQDRDLFDWFQDVAIT